MPAGQSALEVASGFAAVLGEPERSLRYFAAAEANTDLTGIQRDPTDDAFLQPLVARARAALAPEAADAAEASGRATGYEGPLAVERAWLAQPGRNAAEAPTG